MLYTKQILEYLYSDNIVITKQILEYLYSANIGLHLFP